MRWLTVLIVGLMLLPVAATTTPNSSATIQQMNRMPLAFTKNMGQWDDRGGFETNAPEDTNKASGRNVREFLTPDGRFDLEAARRSGYQGPLDMKGFESAFDTSSGQPVFRPASPASPTDNPDDIYWSPLGSGMNNVLSMP